MKKTIFTVAWACLYAAISLAQTQPNAALQTFLRESGLVYYEEPHGDLLTNSSVTMPVWSGCAVSCKLAACECSQWQSSQYILDRLAYPPDGYKAGWVGEFRLEYTIDSLGNVRDAEVVNCDAATLAQQFLAIINTMPRWVPAQYNGKITPIRYYTQFSFSGDTDIDGAPESGVSMRWGNARATAQKPTLQLTAEALNAVKNEPIRFFNNGEAITITGGEVVFVQIKPAKTSVMEADETLNEEHTAKLSAFIDANIQSGCTIAMRKITAVNSDNGETMSIPDFLIEIL